MSEKSLKSHLGPVDPEHVNVHDDAALAGYLAKCAAKACSDHVLRAVCRLGAEGSSLPELVDAAHYMESARVAKLYELGAKDLIGATRSALALTPSPNLVEMVSAASEVLADDPHAQSTCASDDPLLATLAETMVETVSPPTPAEVQILSPNVPEREAEGRDSRA